MEDQDGNLIHLPPAEKKAIMMALAIHEKGRAALKRNDYNEALLFLLEADSDYKMSNSQLLQSVDNIPRLNLDIVWCYVMLKVSVLNRTLLYPRPMRERFILYYPTRTVFFYVNNKNLIRFSPNQLRALDNCQTPRIVYECAKIISSEAMDQI